MAIKQKKKDRSKKVPIKEHKRSVPMKPVRRGKKRAKMILNMVVLEKQRNNAR